jgi:hypothetical protein
MAGKTLVEFDVNSGKALLATLDKSRLPVKAALWLYTSENEQWRLILGIARVDAIGARETYRLVQSALQEVPPENRISMSDITVMSPNSPLLRNLASAISTDPAPAIAGLRFSNNMVNNTFIEDAYVYRLNVRTHSPK